MSTADNGTTAANENSIIIGQEEIDWIKSEQEAIERTNWSIFDLSELLGEIVNNNSHRTQEDDQQFMTVACSWPQAVSTLGAAIECLAEKIEWHQHEMKLILDGSRNANELRRDREAFRAWKAARATQ